MRFATYGYLVMLLLIPGLIVGLGTLASSYPDYDQTNLTWSVIGVWLLAWIAMSILLVVNAVRLARRRDVRVLKRHMMILKLGMVPFFLLNYVAWFLLMMIAGAATHGLAVFVAWVPVALTYLLMMPTMTYPWALTVAAGEKGLLRPFWIGVHWICQLAFVLDVIAAVVLWFQVRRAERIQKTDAEASTAPPVAVVETVPTVVAPPGQAPH